MGSGLLGDPIPLGSAPTWTRSFCSGVKLQVPVLSPLRLEPDPFEPLGRWIPRLAPAPLEQAGHGSGVDPAPTLLCPNRAMLEQAQNRRLLVDSDSDEEPAKSRPNPAAQTKPTDILQEVSEAQPPQPFPSPNPLSWSCVCPLCPCSERHRARVTPERLPKAASGCTGLRGARDHLGISGCAW